MEWMSPICVNYWELQEGVKEALEKISLLWETKVAAEAFQLVQLKNCLLNPSNIPNLFNTPEQVSSVRRLAPDWSCAPCTKFHKGGSWPVKCSAIYLRKQSLLLRTLDIVLSFPRISKKQQHWSNFEEKYQRSITVLLCLYHFWMNLTVTMNLDILIVTIFLAISTVCYLRGKGTELCTELILVLEFICEDEFIVAEIKMCWRKIVDSRGRRKKEKTIFHTLDVFEGSEELLCVRKLLKILTILPQWQKKHHSPSYTG